MKKIALVDGYGFVFRAYHSLPPLTRSDKTPVGAVYGFTNMLIKLIAGLNVSHIAVVFDSGSKTFRNEIYPDYKANRPPCPEDLKPQFPIIRECAEALNLKVLEKIGFEADDIIATIAKKSAAAGFEVVIVSSDKDLMQLVDDHILMFDAMKNKILGHKEVSEKFFVEPKQVLDILSLIGDSSDNIPGVRGIGPKTAAELLAEFKTLENLFENLDSIKQERRRQLLLDGKESAFLSKKLATLDENVELGISLSDLAIKAIEPDKLINFLEIQGFRSLILKVKKEFGINDSQLPLRLTKSNELEKRKNFTKSTESEQSQRKLASEIDGIDVKNIINAEFIPIKTKIDLKNLHDLSIKNGQIAIDYLANDRNLFFITFATSQSFENPRQVFYCDFFSSKQEENSKNSLQVESSKKNADNIIQINQSLVDLPLFATNNKVEKSEDFYQRKELLQLEIQDFLPIIFDDSIRKIFFDSKNFLRFLKNYFRDNSDLYPEFLHQKIIFDDVGLQNYLLNSSIHNGLRELIEANLNSNFEENGYGEILSKIESCFKSIDLNKPDVIMAELLEIFKEKEQKISFFCLKNIAILQLNKVFAGQIFRQKLNNSYFEYELPLIDVLAQMEFNGIKIDAKKLKILSDEFEQRIFILTNEIHSLAGEKFNIASSKQLGEILFKKLGLNSSKKSKKTGAPSSSARVLDELAEDGYEIAIKLREFRKLSKLKNTYTDSLPKDINRRTGRIHTYFSNTSTLTGRLSSSSPNLQNIPAKSDEGKRIRQCFIAEEGNVLISADYSQIELRVIAHLAKIKNLIEAFKSDKDIHRITAAEVFETTEDLVDEAMRNKAKAINFGIIYGISPFGLARQLKISNSEAASYIDSYLKTYPGISEFMTSQIELARQLGYVQTISGRKCIIQHINDENRIIRNEAERQAINAPVQGSAADIIKKAMIGFCDIIKKEKLPTKLVLQIHDELVVESPKKFSEKIAEILQKEMEKSFKLEVPLKIDFKIT